MESGWSPEEMACSQLSAYRLGDRRFLGPSCGVGELEVAGGGAGDGPFGVVDEGVMAPAQKDEVVDVGFTQ